MNPAIKVVVALLVVALIAVVGLIAVTGGKQAQDPAAAATDAVQTQAP